MRERAAEKPAYVSTGMERGGEDETKRARTEDLVKVALSSLSGVGNTEGLVNGRIGCGVIYVCGRR